MGPGCVALSGREHRPAEFDEFTAANERTEGVLFVPGDLVAQFDDLLTIEADHRDVDGFGDFETRVVGR